MPLNGGPAADGGRLQAENELREPPRVVEVDVPVVVNVGVFPHRGDAAHPLRER